MASALRDSELDQKWWVFRDVEPMKAWDDYAAELSVHLSEKAFESVTQSVSELSRWALHVRATPTDASGSFWPMNPDTLVFVKAMRENATKAFNALAEIAEDKEVVPEGQLLHDDLKSTAELFEEKRDA